MRSGRPSNGALPYPYGPSAHAAGSSEPSEDSPPVFLPLHPALLSLPLAAEAVTGDEVMNQLHPWPTYDRWLPRRPRCLPGRPQRYRTHFDPPPPRYQGPSRLLSVRISVRLATNARHLRWSSQRQTPELPLPISDLTSKRGRQRVAYLPDDLRTLFFRRDSTKIQTG